MTRFAPALGSHSVCSRRLTFGHLHRADPRQDHHWALHAYMLGPPVNWRWRIGRPRQFWLRTVEADPRLVNLGLANCEVVCPELVGLAETCGNGYVVSGTLLKREQILAYPSVTLVRSIAKPVSCTLTECWEIFVQFKPLLYFVTLSAQVWHPVMMSRISAAVWQVSCWSVVAGQSCTVGFQRTFCVGARRRWSSSLFEWEGWWTRNDTGWTKIFPHWYWVTCCAKDQVVILKSVLSRWLLVAVKSIFYR